MKVFLFLLIGMFVFVMISGMGNAVECGNVPTDQCTVTASTVFANGNYYLNDSLGGVGIGAIRVQVDNIVLDCNNSFIIGNTTTGENVAPQTIGLIFNTASRKNITIQNCNLNNFWSSFKTRGNNLVLINVTSNNSYYGFDFETTNNSVIINSSISNPRGTGIYVDKAVNNTFNMINITGGNSDDYLVWFDTTGDSNTIINSFFSANTIRVRGSRNNISFSNFINGNKTYDYGSIFLNGGDFNMVFNNTFIGNASRIDSEGSNNSEIFYNKIYNITQQSHCIGSIIGTKNIKIHNNFLYNCDIGILVTKNTGTISIINNTINNTYAHFDSYDAGIFFELGGNVNAIVDGNNIDNFGTVGIGLKNSTNVTISNNIISGLVNRTNKGYYDYFEPQVAIGLYEDYKGFSGDGKATSNWTSSDWSAYKNYNIIISNNNISNVAVLLLDKNTINLIHDLNNYWFRSFKSNGLSEKYSLYNSNNFNFIDRIDINQNVNYTIGVCTLSNCSIFYKQNRTFSFYQNTQPSSDSVSVFNLTSPRFYNGTLTTGTILNNNNATLVLDPQQQIYVGDAGWN